jgi:hypothetical protein
MKERLRIGLLLATVALVYANTLWNQFTWDDELYITSNPQVTQFSWRGLLAANRVTNVFRPLTFGSFAFNWALQGAHPFGFHLLNLLLHGAVTLLLYWLLCALLDEVPHGTTMALVAAALFAVHPIHTEAVTSIVGRPELLAAGFLLAAWLLHLRDLQIPALICFALALLSKESAASFLPLVEITPAASGSRRFATPGSPASPRLTWRCCGRSRAAASAKRGLRCWIILWLRFRAGGEFSMQLASPGNTWLCRSIPPPFPATTPSTKFQCTGTGATLCPRLLPPLRSLAHGFGQFADGKPNGFWPAPSIWEHSQPRRTS